MPSTFEKLLLTSGQTLVGTFELVQSVDGHPLFWRSGEAGHRKVIPASVVACAFELSSDVLARVV